MILGISVAMREEAKIMQIMIEEIIKGVTLLWKITTIGGIIVRGEMITGG